MKYRILKHSKAPYDKVHEECGVFGIYELLPAFVLSFAAIIIVSLLTPAPSEAVANEFDHYMDEGGAAVEKVVQ